MSTSTWSIERGDLRVIVTGPTQQASGQDLLTAAVLALVEAADTEGWEKAWLEAGGVGAAPADQFYAAVLAAVAQHYAIGAPLPQSGPAHALLMDLIAGLVERGQLHAVIRPFDGDEG